MTAHNLEVKGDPELVDRFYESTLPPEALPELLFRARAVDPWTRHPQVEFVGASIEPSEPLPGASLRWQQLLVGSPCGRLPVWHRFVDGRKETSGIGFIDAPEVATTMQYRSILDLMEGNCDTLEAFENGGHIEGEWSAMLLLLGISEQPEFVTAMRNAVGNLGPGLRQVADGSTTARS